MNLALAIVFTGRVNADELREAQESQPGPSKPRDAWLKTAARAAKYRYKTGKLLHKRVCRGDSIDDFTEEERQLLNDFRSGVLLHNKNRAVVTFGHGTVHNEFGEAVEIGGSTQGLTRTLLDLTPSSPLE